jgi:DNA-binding CsgD family transcriptional regulator
VTGKHRTIPIPTAHDLVRAFNLTRTEAEVTLELAAGLTPADIAARRGASVHTVRTHLKRVLVKTETHTQAALVGKVLRP